MQINLLGYYGFHNIGDDLMLENLLTYFLESGRISRINVFCRETYYPNKEGVQYYPVNRFSRLQKAVQLIKNRYTLWGGGTCIYQSKTSRGLFELRRQQKIAATFGRRFGLLGIGIGELKDKKYIDTAINLLRDSNFVYFRDEESLQSAKLLAEKNYCLGGDLVFLSDIEPVPPKDELRKISFSGHYNFKKYPLQLMAENLKELIDKMNCKIYFLPAHTGSSYNDNEYHKQLATYLKPGFYEICDWDVPEEYIQILGEMDFHIGIRLHSLVLSDMLGIPNCGIAYSHKITYYLKKTQVLPDLRNIEIANNDLIDNILKIKEQYKYPETFIKSERKSALNCLDKVFSNG